MSNHLEQTIHPLFDTYTLNDIGKHKAIHIAHAFTKLLTELSGVIGIQADDRGQGARELAIVRTHLEIAKQFSVRSVAVQPKNQAASPPINRAPTEKAKMMFDTYNEQGPNPWKTHDGKDVPKWEDLNDQVRSKWIAAASLSFD